MTFAGFSLEQLFVLPIALAAFVVLLTIIVFFHEFGHFFIARLLGVRVDAFSIGFGKPLLSWTDRHGTEWRIAMLPFGGYVKFFGDAGPASDASAEVKGETEDGPNDGDKRDNEARLGTTQFPNPDEADKIGRGMTPEEKAVCFHFKPVWRRAAIVAAGPIANFLLAMAIFWGIYVSYGEFVTAPVVGEVRAASAAEEAGFQTGDVVRSIDGKQVRSFRDMQLIIMLSAGETLDFEVEREGRTIPLEATPRRETQESRFGESRVGVLGIASAPGATTQADYGPVDALARAGEQVGAILSGTLKFLGRLIFGKEDARNLGGPIKMAQYAGQSALSGFDESAYAETTSFWKRLQVSLANFVNLAAVVSVSIGFLNLLPVPVLDGGHLMYYAYEAVAGRPLGVRAQEVGFKLGLIMLASLMVFVTWNDVSSLLFNNS